MNRNFASQLSLNLFNDLEVTNQPLLEVITMPNGEPMPDGQIVMYRNFFNQVESNQTFQELLNGIKWRQDKMKLFGKEVDLPRLTAWYGDEGKSYTYSGIPMNPDTWTPTLLSIKSRIEEVAQVKFNSVLVNLYRSGKDSVSWHTDDEPELGKDPIIGSVSFGEVRRFQMKHKLNKSLDKIEIALTHGSLLIMKGSTQHFWQHQIPKTSKSLRERINLTFRIIK
jgi:alkylated DNA repair dioxygenase AlkB